MESKAPAIAEYLFAHYPCEALPFGALTIVGERLGVSRERVRQVAISHGFTGYRSQPVDERVSQITMKGRSLCPSCGNPSSQRRYREDHVSRTRCKACQYIEIACTNCGKLKRIRASFYLSHTNSNRRLSTPDGGTTAYTGRQFCNRKCFGQWVAHTVGFAAHPENAINDWARRRQKANRERILAGLPGQVEEIAARAGVALQTVRNHLNPLTAEGIVQKTALRQTSHPWYYSLKEQP